jgi:ClpP class serine protease
VLRIGAYKGAGEPLTRRSLSPESREQLAAYLDDVLDGLVAAIAAGRGRDAAAVRDAIERGPHRAARACELGLADACRYPDEVEEALVERLPESGEASDADGRQRPRIVDARSYAGLHAHDAGFVPWLREPARIAYVVAEGAIHRRGPRGIAADATTRLLRTIGDDESVRAIVLRIDSPGGDALASDVIWRALAVAKRGRPLVVSMGEVAASGGYFAAVAGDAILAEAATLTGSIGVAGGKLDAGAALASSASTPTRSSAARVPASSRRRAASRPTSATRCARTWRRSTTCFCVASRRDDRWSATPCSASPKGASGAAPARSPTDSSTRSEARSKRSARRAPAPASPPTNAWPCSSTRASRPSVCCAGCSDSKPRSRLRRCPAA